MINNIFRENWPINELENVPVCPYCSSESRELAYENVQDWSFQSAPGKWRYWDCINCNCLYLSPRPTHRSISLAYSSYYTQDIPTAWSIYSAIKVRLKNDWISSIFGLSFTPRLYIPQFIMRVAAALVKKNKIPFGWEVLKNRNKGNLLDFGCGSGFTLSIAQRLGWKAFGIDADSLAVESARRKGINVIKGSHEILKDFPSHFDCVICSHALEHVYFPKELLEGIAGSMRNDGVLLLSLPNSASALRKYFGGDWRGLEAPRHISIPSQSELVKILESLGFSVAFYGDTEFGNVVECFRVRRRSLSAQLIDFISAKMFMVSQSFSDGYDNDFIKLICTKRPEADSLSSSREN